jgi:hypothetical protein
METKNSKKYQEYIKMRNQVKELVRKAKAIGSIFGISPSGSLVNTLLKKFASTSAFSLSVDVLFSSPFSFLYFSSDIPDFVFL